MSRNSQRQISINKYITLVHIVQCVWGWLGEGERDRERVTIDRTEQNAMPGLEWNLSVSLSEGDVRQLPSIQPGNTLKDLFSSLTVVNHTVEMLINHRSESELIVANAQRFVAFNRLLSRSDFMLSFNSHFVP